MWMRTIKSAEEQKLIREGARVCDVGGAACVAAIKAGVPEYEVAIATTNAIIREIAKGFPYVEFMDTWTWFKSGINTDERTIRSPTASCTRATATSRARADAVLRPRRRLEPRYLGEGRRRPSARARPGARCKDIAAELNETYRG
jgi:creatinase